MVELYRVWDKPSRALTRVVTDNETGLPIIIRSHDPSILIEVNKRQAASFDRTVRRDVTHVARIPAPVAARLRRLGMLRDDKALTAWLNERDNRVFRVDDGRKL